ncbi:Conserved_hypothetical protein [Hexamita inflata]|uniref:Uncharacterized protein n=1 Tax=Hexamita inflata TaxID=28002 RepID=A0AA86Q443_9EUKA|nr:Conserved hypothetical protein [Hexamita inflata]CAI9956295.1 Conserved hypothetical protein [Hexamita inflata]
MIVDISVLSYLHQLETAYLAHNKIQNIQALAQLKELIHVDVSHNYIQNLSPLQNHNTNNTNDEQDTFVRYNFESSVSSTTQNNLDEILDIVASDNHISIESIIEILGEIDEEPYILAENQLEPTQLQTTVMGGGIAFSCLLCEQLYIKIFCHFQCG